MVKHLKNYRSYLHRKKSNLEGGDSDYAMFEGAIKAVNNLLVEVRKGQV